MRIRSASDVVYTAIAWLPLLAVVIGVAWVLMFGVLHLEKRSFGSEFFIGNDQSTNLPETLGPSNEDILADALASGDTTRMSQALDQVEARQERMAKIPRPGA
ncbi:MAG: hypothetical protein JWM98_2439 [Thermoleophilia bacterium]|nr:hypothetical protein [Thermoleophilia bacterium]